MFGTVGFVSKRFFFFFFFNIYRFLGLTLFVSKYLPFSEPGVTILSPRTVKNVRFRPGQANVSGMGGISPKIWRHHKPEVTSSKFNFVESRRVGYHWID